MHGIDYDQREEHIGEVKHLHWYCEYNHQISLRVEHVTNPQEGRKQAEHWVRKHEYSDVNAYHDENLSTLLDQPLLVLRHRFWFKRIEELSEDAKYSDKNHI